MRTVIAEGEASGSSIDVVLLVGGSCKMPIVRDVIAEVTGRTATRRCRPDDRGCRGRGDCGAILEGEHDGDFFVATEHALGTAVVDSTGSLAFSTSSRAT